MGHLIFIFIYPSRKKEIPKKLFSYDLLITPQIVNNQGWLKGYFEQIEPGECRTKPINDEVRKIDYE